MWGIDDLLLATVYSTIVIDQTKSNIPLPPIQLQATFNDCVSWSVAMRNSITKMLEKLDDLFAPIQHRAFRGELGRGSTKDRDRTFNNFDFLSPICED
jgi:hypothetical protein